MGLVNGPWGRIENNSCYTSLLCGEVIHYLFLAKKKLAGKMYLSAFFNQAYLTTVTVPNTFPDKF